MFCEYSPLCLYFFPVKYPKFCKLRTIVILFLLFTTKEGRSIGFSQFSLNYGGLFENLVFHEIYAKSDFFGKTLYFIFCYDNLK